MDKNNENFIKICYFLKILILPIGNLSSKLLCLHVCTNSKCRLGDPPSFPCEIFFSTMVWNFFSTMLFTIFGPKIRPSSIYGLKWSVIVNYALSIIYFELHVMTMILDMCSRFREPQISSFVLQIVWFYWPKKRFQKKGSKVVATEHHNMGTENIYLLQTYQFGNLSEDRHC